MQDIRGRGTSQGRFNVGEYDVSDGAESVDYQIVAKPVGDAMLDRYVRTAGPCPTLGPPAFDATAGRSARTQQPVPLPVGQYFVVLDNSSVLGRSAPPAGAAGDNAARVDYALMLGPKD